MTPAVRRSSAVALLVGGLVVLTVAGQPGITPTAAAAAQQRSARADLATVPAANGPADGLAEDRVNVELTSATLDAAGLPDHALLISRLTDRGPAHEVLDPASVTNVRYLDRLGRPATSGDGVLLQVGGDDPVVLTEARFDKPLPVAMHVEYSVGGQVIPAAQVPGQAGDVTITYTMTNTTAEQQELTYTDAAGDPHTATVPVFAPYQGTLTVTLPADALLVDGGDAVLGTDERGRTVAQWNLSLFPPISEPIQHATLTLRTDRAAVPAARVLLVPAGTDQAPAAAFSATLLDGSTRSSDELYEGLTELDAGAAALAEGSGQLSVGLSRLASGTDQAATASGTLADGIGDLAEGADQVADGSSELATALGRASRGAAALAEATDGLAAAADADPARQLAPLLTGGQQIEAGLDTASARIGGPSDPVLDLIVPIPPDGDDICPAGGTAPPDDDCVTIYQGVRALRDGLAAVDRVVDAMLAQADTIRAAGAELAGDLQVIADGSAAAAEGAQQLYADLCQGDAPTLDAGSCAQLQLVVDNASAAAGTSLEDLPIVGEVVAALKALDAQASAIGRAVDTALASTERLLAGVGAIGPSVGRGTADQPGLASAMSALNAGLAQLSAELTRSQARLSDALDQVAEGNDDLALGIDAAASGADSLAQGSDQLADGAQDAAAGAGQLADGLGQVASGADSAASAGQDLATGAGQLQEDGTAPAAAAVLDASTDPALADAWLAAAGARSADALPYGPPSGWAGQAAYVFTIEQVDPPQSLWDRIRGLLAL